MSLLRYLENTITCGKIKGEYMVNILWNVLGGYG
jgi:hypothetical protein